MSETKRKVFAGTSWLLLACEELDGKTVAEMRLTNALWRFVELARA